MKKIINRPETLVSEMCAGIAVTYPGLEFDQPYRVIKKKNISQEKVTLISGGGSGHEPAHAGFVGKGMLDAAICGDVFASPSQIQVYQGIRQTASKKGTLLIVKNYSGDIMNFSSAAEMAREEGIDVDFIKVDDDIAVRDSLYTVGRRGVAGTVLVHKVAGAAAQEGLTLPEVKAVAQKAIDNVRSIGFAYSSCVVPAAGAPTFAIGEDEMEYGVGIHGEPGARREKQITARELSERMIDQLVEDLGPRVGDELVLLVNGFGGTPLQELFVLSYEAAKVLDSKGIKLYRAFTGNYMTSIDMLGASLSILKLDDTLKKYIDAPCLAPGFFTDGNPVQTAFVPLAQSQEGPVANTTPVGDGWNTIQGRTVSFHNMVAMVASMCDCIIRNEVPFCKIDAHAGDGDFGMSVAKGFLKVRGAWQSLIEGANSSIKEFLLGCSLLIMEHCGGASGPIWGSAFRAAALSAGDVSEMDLTAFAQMMQAAVSGVQRTGERSFGRGAVVGDKTLIDALVPCADTLTRCAKEGIPIKDALHQGAKAAQEGAERTKDIVARMGRAGVVGERSIGHPDAGAYALGVIFEDVANNMN